MKRNTTFLALMLTGIFFCSIVQAYPNKVTVINASNANQKVAVTIANATLSEAFQTINHEEMVTFQGNMYTKVRVAARVASGGVSGAAGAIQSFADVQDTFNFQKDFSGEITLLVDTEYKLKVIKAVEGSTPVNK